MTRGYNNCGPQVFLGTKHAIPEMRKAGGGSIISISSIYGLVGSSGATAYHASKGAVRLFTKATAVQHAAVGVLAGAGFCAMPAATTRAL